MQTISSKELQRATGASYRQVDYWCRTGIIPTVGVPCPGSGDRREFDEEIVKKVRLLVNVSKTGIKGTGLLKDLFNNYDYGALVLGEELELMLVWKREGKSWILDEKEE